MRVILQSHMICKSHTWSGYIRVIIGKNRMRKSNIWLIIIECICMAGMGIGLFLARNAYAQQEHSSELVSLETQRLMAMDSTPEEMQSSVSFYSYPVSMSFATNLSLEDAGAKEEPSELNSLDHTMVSSDHLLDSENYASAPLDNGNPYYIKVNRSQNVVTVYALDEDGRYTVPVRAFVCSVGKNNATPTGTFRTSDKHEWSALVGGVYGQYAYRIDGHIMFHSVPYYSRNKGNLESEEYNKLGTAASLGCVRMAVQDVKWIYENCPSGTLVTIYDSDYPGPLGKPAAETIDLADDRSGWDPTDPDTDNPWNTGNIRFFGCGPRILERGYTYDLLAGVRAYDENGNELTDRIQMSTDCNPWETGVYEITYQLTTPEGRTASVQSTVQVQDHQSPDINVEQEYITLNRIQASANNWEQAIREQIQITDAGMELSDSHLQIQMEIPEENSTQMEAVLIAIDDSGNVSEKKAAVYIDWQPPIIAEPENYEISGGTDDEIREQFLKEIKVTDAESGVGELHITWTKHISFNTYNVMVIAKDYYGNVTTSFFEGFRIETVSNENPSDEIASN